MSICQLHSHVGQGVDGHAIEMQSIDNMAALVGTSLPRVDHASHLAWCSVNNLISIGIREQDLVLVKVFEPRHLDEHTDLLVSEGQ